jgi:hypothetical protein
MNELLIIYCHLSAGSKVCNNHILQNQEEYHQLVKEVRTWNSPLIWTKLVELDTGKTLIEEQFPMSMEKLISIFG